MIIIPDSTPDNETEHIVLDTPEARRLAANWKNAGDGIALLEANQTVARDTLQPLALNKWLEANHGVEKPAASVVVPGADVLITFGASWTGCPDALPAEHKRQKFGFKIDGSRIPPAKAQAFVNDLMALVAKHGVKGALKITDEMAPSKEFGVARHKLDPAANLELERLGLGTKVSFKAR